MLIFKKTKLLVFILLLGASIGFSLVAKSPKASAALAPGCYVYIGGKYEVSNCPTDLHKAGVDIQGKCFVASGGSGGIGDYNERPCIGLQPDRTSSTGGTSSTAPHYCGSGDGAVGVSFNIGCKGIGNPIIDMLFALIRFLSAGVGIVLVGAMIVAGIQHTLAQDKPDATANLMKRLIMLAVAIVVYALTFAFLNYLVPGGLFI